MDVRQPRAGHDYPRSTGEFQSWFATEADCLDYLEWLRWPDGFVCPRCDHAGGWAVGDGRYKCAGCGARTSVTAGTLFDRRRTPLTVWFTACWMFASQKDGVSALSLQRTLEIGSYATAWAMLHRLRSVLVRPGRDRLTGRVEVDETFIGGEEPGLSGGRAKGKKSLVAVAVEVHEPRGYGRVRMGIIADASAACLHPFITANVEPGGTVITDGWQGYSGIERAATPVTGAANELPAPEVRTRASSCPECTASPPWPSAGCWARTRAQSTRPTCRATWTSSPSASTAADQAAAAWCSTASSSWPSGTRPSATATSSSTPGPRRSSQCRPEAAVTRRAWTARERRVPGEPLICSSPVS